VREKTSENPFHLELHFCDDINEAKKLACSPLFCSGFVVEYSPSRRIILLCVLSLKEISTHN
ncbi:MAG TPA: hypothetical protein PK309_08870, partial [Bacillota bacterium]|nr:hypothetical protein [Bacillota bacterium]